jgi:phosphopentomutase
MVTPAPTRSGTSPIFVRAAPGTASGLREGPLHLPNLLAVGLGLACERRRARAAEPRRLRRGGRRLGLRRRKPRAEKTRPSGHWEIAGCPVDFDWGYFPKTEPGLSARTARGR